MAFGGTHNGSMDYTVREATAEDADAMLALMPRLADFDVPGHRNPEDLWRALDEAAERHDVTWEWVKGHAGHPENERADKLARDGMKPFKPKKAPSPSDR